MFTINVERYKELINDGKIGDLTYSDLIEFRDKSKDVLDDIEAEMDRRERLNI